MANPDSILEVVYKYLATAPMGTGAEIAALYAPGARVEDPVGTPAHVGTDAIAAFYDSVRGGERTIELLTLRVAADTAAFHFRVTTVIENTTIVVEPIDVMTFDDQSRITSMRAIWSPADLVTSTV
ncbi:nuclear transport factor 2 family protein [Gordonia rubripertincta]|uniref:Nuclear transport factor 2 family protein n=1 Tax=Gordonia rubripertincta TaxID=36822 RepID=A0ABT4MPE2_GORRU|nr:nuclear transport factor 2 family protein [Gordonia rubripertincta]MCZ4548870.1 nuclear transport factor 2 family protein [Gordonia rubripertincta]